MNIRVTLSERQHLILFKLLEDRIDDIYQQQGDCQQLSALRALSIRMRSAYLTAKRNEKK